jgi:murein DD-endopeptidase MepM/ murein hydrolase activator NlpD
MQKKGAIIVLLVIVIATVGLYLHFKKDSNEPNGEEGLFDNGGRYDSSKLDYMGVIFTNQSDILNWNGGYSESEACPWGRVHNGLDFGFRNSSTVIFAAPGYVEEILVVDAGPVDNEYSIHVSVRFNETIQVSYVFEPWTTNSSDVVRQTSMLRVEVGDWVAKGEILGEFLAVGGGAHIHFAVYNGEATCPRPFFSDDAYTEMMALVHTYQPGWELCYP